MLTPTLLGPIDVLGTEVVGGVMVIEFLLLAIVIANLAIRAVAHRSHVRTAREEGVDAITRNPTLDATNVLLLLGAFYYTTVHVHGGVVLTVLTIGLVIADLFEFEARLIEARKGQPLERPNSALVASSLVFTYIAYQSLFFLVRPFWEMVV